MSKFIPSENQIEIFKTYSETDSNIVISAVPGSGKTTTIIELLKRTKYHRKAIFLAFNKSIVDELQTKVPAGTEVSTLHSLGCKAIYRHYRGQVQVNSYKLYKIAKQISKTFQCDKKKIDFYIFNLIKIVDLYRLRLETEKEAFLEIIMHYDIDTIGNEQEDSYKLFLAYQNYNSNWEKDGNKFIIDFVDMVYLPNVSKVQLGLYDDVFIDESQDLNKAQQKLVEQIIKPQGGRFVAVGDPRQSIYGFMSADSMSYQNFASKKNTVQLPLSYSYRCGKNIINEANKVWNVIKSPDFMFDGEVIQNANLNDVKEGDFILCRNNKPLVSVYFKLLINEQKCYIKGSEIGKSIIFLLKGTENLSKDLMYQYLEKMISDLFLDLNEKGIKNPTQHEKYVSLCEKVNIIKIIGDKYNSVKEIISVIEKMFLDESKGVMLSSIHKSKGLETDNVYILERSLIPSEYAKTQQQLEQENNLLYVAITRAKKKLGYL